MAFVSDRLDSLDRRPSRQTDRNGAGLEPRPSFWRRLVARPAPAPAASPWGEIVDRRETIPGIHWFRTAFRSGYQLSAGRQRALPRRLRTADGWYEDRSEWAAVAVVFDRIFDKLPVAGNLHNATLYEAGKETLKNWRPEEYESWFQTTLDAAEIESLAIIQFHRLYAGRWIVIDRSGDQPALAADGRLRVRAKQGGDPPYGAGSGRSNAPSRWFLVDADEFAHGRGLPFLIDPARHRETVAAPD